MRHHLGPGPKAGFRISAVRSQELLVGFQGAIVRVLLQCFRDPGAYPGDNMQTFNRLFQSASSAASARPLRFLASRGSSRPVVPLDLSADPSIIFPAILAGAGTMALAYSYGTLRQMTASGCPEPCMSATGRGRSGETLSRALADARPSLIAPGWPRDRHGSRSTASARALRSEAAVELAPLPSLCGQDDGSGSGKLRTAAIKAGKGLRPSPSLLQERR
jgi:hypothetical protein